MTTNSFLCNIDEIEQDATKGFNLGDDKDEQTIFIVNRNNRFFAYKNFCPHTGANLNWQPDVYMDYDNLYIQCAIHGARFEVETGFCVWGPCANQSLIRVAIEVKDEKIYLAQKL